MKRLKRPQLRRKLIIRFHQFKLQVELQLLLRSLRSKLVSLTSGVLPDQISLTALVQYSTFINMRPELTYHVRPTIKLRSVKLFLSTNCKRATWSSGVLKRLHITLRFILAIINMLIPQRQIKVRFCKICRVITILRLLREFYRNVKPSQLKDGFCYCINLLITAYDSKNWMITAKSVIVFLC